MKADFAAPRKVGGALTSGRGRCAPRRQSLLRSCLASRSFPRRPPATCYPRSGHPSGRSRRNLGSTGRAKPHHAGGGGGKECGLPRSAARRAEWAARHEPTLRGVDSATTGPRGARSAPPNPDFVLRAELLLRPGRWGGRRFWPGGRGNLGGSRGARIGIELGCGGFPGSP